MRLVECAKSYIKSSVSNGSLCIDLTCGNGLDTLFLSKLVKKEGKVYAFDIQQQAVQFTRNLLREHKYISQVEIFQQCHSSFTEHLPQELKYKISAVMVNLGYLPKGSHLITTNPRTTCVALVKAYEWLSVNGVISVITYQGHEGGIKENIAVKNLISEYHWDCTTEFGNKKQDSPILYMIRKK
jgi:16S rRNA C1402 N4-methylase RsmH